MISVEQTYAQLKEIQSLIERAIEKADTRSVDVPSDLFDAQTRLQALLCAQGPGGQSRDQNHLSTEPANPAPNPHPTESRMAYLAGLIDYIHDAIIATDAHEKITAWNRAAETLYGWKASEVIGRSISEVIPSSFTEEEYQAARQALKESGHFEGILIQYARDGRALEIETSTVALRTRRGRTSGFLAANRDLTGRRQTEEALYESQSRLLLATGTAGIGAWDWNLRTGEFTFDQRACEIFGLQDSHPVNYERLLQTIYPNDREAAMQQIQKAREEGQTYEHEFRVLAPDGAVRWVYAKGQSYPDRTGRPARMIGVALDMTQREEVAANARRINAQTEVQHRLMDQRERERLSIARDLHDGPVQDLIAISFGLQSAAQEAADPQEGETLRELRDAVHEVVTALRSYAGELRPPALAKFGLEKAIRSHVEEFRRKHPEIQLTLRMHQTGPLTPEPVRLALYRIYQEAMNNIVRHSHATEVLIYFEKDEYLAEFEIRDNGEGYNLPYDWLDLARHGHLGLVGIQERAEAVGGTAVFTSQPGEGSSVLVRIPLVYPDSSGGDGS